MDILRAIYSDTTAEFISKTEPEVGDTIRIRIRTPRAVTDKVQLIVDDGIMPMKRIRRKGDFEYYEAKVTLYDKMIRYYFRVTVKEENYIYDYRGVTPEDGNPDAVDDKYFFRVIPGYKTPDWAKGAVFYQIYVDRFCNGDESNDVITGEYKYIDSLVESRDWNGPIDNGIHEHFGGDLKGVISKLDYLKKLGVDVIYLNPIFVSPSNHKYDTADYDYVDPHFGVILKDEGNLLGSPDKDNKEAGRFISRVTSKENLEASNELFSKLVEEAHTRGIRVILDGVFNHCGSFNKWMDTERIYEDQPDYPKGAYIAKDSPYHDYFTFKDGGEWPYNDSFEAWWDYKTLPKLNYNCKELYDYILKIGAKWVSEPYNADGWRLDVAADLGPDPETNHRFWEDFRKTVKEANPDAIILAEHYGDASAWLSGGQWDTVMNYDAFMEPVSWFLTGIEKHSDEYKPELIGDTDAFWNSMALCSARFAMPSLQTAMNELSNHDHSRFLTRTTHKAGRVEELGTEAATEGSDKAVLRQAVVIQMTWTGAPTLYYGDEAGLAGFTDPDNRRPYPWGNEDKELIKFHRKAIKLHKLSPELSLGSLMRLPVHSGSLAYARVYRKEASIVIVNTMNVAMEYKLPVWMLGIGKGKKYRTRLRTDRNGFKTRGRVIKDEDGILTVIVEAGGAVILRHKKAGFKKKRVTAAPPKPKKKAKDKTVTKAEITEETTVAAEVTEPVITEPITTEQTAAQQTPNTDNKQGE